nr:hypothetical protein CFP56_20435 [Quercus suber]
MASHAFTEAFAPEPKLVAEQVHAGGYQHNDDEYELNDGVVARKWQGTAADRKDMSQLGRVQELRVCRKLDCIDASNRLASGLLTFCVAELCIPVHPRIWLHLDRYLGSAHHHLDYFIDRWRHRWPAVGIYYHRHRLFLRLHVHRRDGIHGTYVGRTIS